MADDNSRGRGLKSSLKNERERVYVRAWERHGRARACGVHTHEAWLAKTSDGGGRAEYNDCRQIAAPRSTCTRTTAGTAKP